jgi:hypothetical protein
MNQGSLFSHKVTDSEIPQFRFGYGFEMRILVFLEEMKKV